VLHTHKIKHSNISKIWCKSALNLPSRNPSATLPHNQTFKHKQNLALEKTYLVAECSHNHEVKASTQPPNVVPLYLTPSPLPSRSRAESSLATPNSSPSHRQPYPLGAFHKRQNLVLFKQTTHSTTKAYIHSSMKLNNIVSISSHLIISQSLALTKMCRKFNLDSYIHSQIQL
jgi:hypothetical protein